MPSVSVIDPRVTPAWDEFVAQHPEATVFHTTAWARVLADTYGYEPRYYVLFDASGDIMAGIALSLVNSRITGRRLVGLPFSDMCPPLARDGWDASTLIEALLRDMEAHRLSYVEIRGSSSLALNGRDFRTSSCFLHHVIPLDRSLEELQKQFHSSARRAIRKAEQGGLDVRSTVSPADMLRFYRLYVGTRRKHGLVPAPYRFFQGIQTHFLAAGSGCLLFAELDGRVIAGDLLLWHQGQIVYKFNASDTRFLNLRPNNALTWEAIQLGKRLGCTTFDLGRCEVDNAGLRRFKNLWAAQELALPYHYHPSVQGFATENQTSLRRTLMAVAVRLTPSLLLPKAGGLIYRHLG